MQEHIIKKIDPSLFRVKTFKNNFCGGVYKVSRQGTFYVLKFAEYCGKSAPSMIARENEALIRAKTIQGITHGISYFQKGDYEALLKEYFEGKMLRAFGRHETLDGQLCGYGTLDSKLFEDIKNTVAQLHSLGIAYLDIREFNIVINKDRNLAKIIDLDSASFSHLVAPDSFEQFKRKDILDLELIARYFK